ncbi:hypothetical protein D5H75_02035 [Bailinhaonella thermotolerans]|uniref:Uncharacterized protein n=2 Tax=Bailinhaonella thermotolerans TaxID=1070861 RepID=A0A3A4BAI2_9ACTN|nr:hypothetical protein D5H75_02035 [Bailinhaonella thermotolerans]
MAVLLWAAAACGGAEPAATTPAGGGGASAADARNAEKAREFSQCMRENGIPGFPDPGPDGKLPAAPLRGLSVDEATQEKALNACREHMPSGMLGGQEDPKVQDQRRKFAQCMRDNGVADFPDPDPEGGFGDGAGFDTGDPSVQKAAEACEPLLTGEGGR